MHKYLLFLWIAIGQISIAAEEPLVDEIRSHLLVLRTFSVERGIDSLTIEEASEKATKESTDPVIIGAFWGIQRGIEKLMEEEHSFETFMGVVHTIKAFGEETPSPVFWRLAKHVYMTTEITPKPYEGENHWQSWFRMHEGPSFMGTREEILGCLLYPVRYTTIHFKSDWISKEIVFYLQAYSAGYGNLYARLKTIDFVNGRKSDDEALELDPSKSNSIALKIPFDTSFEKDKSDMNKFLWTLANNSFKHGYHYVPAVKIQDVLAREVDVLKSIQHPTAESDYCLAVTLLGMDNLTEAEAYLIRSMNRGLRDALYLFCAKFNPKKYEWTEEIPPLASDGKLIIMNIYKEVFGL